MTSTRADTTETVLVMNPNSGTADHGQLVRERAALLGYEVQETERENQAIELARRAAEGGVDEVVAVGGDGTLNEVVRGVAGAGALDCVTVGVVPSGTGNDFAANVGITGIEDAFHVLEDGERRRLDLGVGNDRPFLNSCVAGITAEASDNTSDASKSRFGVLAYVLQTLQLASEYSGIDITAAVADDSGRDRVWEGTATVVLVGNGRRFSHRGSEQANLEDGRFDVTILDDVDSLDLARDHLRERLFGEADDSITRFLASSLEVRIGGPGPARFSFDGEMVELEALELETRPGAVEMTVGPEYRPSPPEGTDG